MKCFFSRIAKKMDWTFSGSQFWFIPNIERFVPILKSLFSQKENI